MSSAGGRRRVVVASVVVLACWLVCPPPAPAGDLYLPFRALAQPLDALHREKPKTGYDSAVEQLAAQIDWLEHHVDAFGTIVAKHPDVWGESRLTRHREEYENEMAKQLGTFTVQMHAALRRSDQAFLGMAMALQAAAGNEPDSGAVDVPTSGTPTITQLITPSVQTADGLAPSVYGTAPFAAGASQTGFGIENKTLSLEPTVQLDQQSRYLYHLQELRRINEGDDTADSPGYALNLVRIPVSILPGKKTRRGFGAEITIIASPYLSDELLPATFRNLVINDLVDQLAYPMTRVVNGLDKDMQTRLEEIGEHHFYVDVNPELRFISERICCTDLLTAEERLADPDVQRDVLLKTLLAIRIAAEHVYVTKIMTEAVTLRPDQRWELPIDRIPERERQTILQAPQVTVDEVKKAVNGGLFRYDCKTAESDPATEGLREEIRQFIQELETKPANNPPEFLPKSDGTNDRERERRNEALKAVTRQSDAMKIAAEKSWSGAVDLQEQLQELSDSFARGTMFSLPATRSRRALLPVPPTQLLTVYDLPLLAHVTADAFCGLRGHPVNQPYLHLMDVQGFLQEELQAAYEFLAHPSNSHLWNHCGPRLAQAIRQRDVNGVKMIRNAFLHNVNVTPDIGGLADGDTTRALAWAIIVEASLLNDQLIRDIKEATVTKGYPGCAAGIDGLPFYLPCPPPEARQVFNDYVRCRWPIRVFALDPVTDQQNIADEFARRRELQVAMALAFASGNLNAQGLMRFTRRLEWDMATVALNQTAVGFSHGNDTFGWRFFPRFQTPPIKGNVATLWESVAGGPTTDQDLRSRQLEPGMRECVAIVVMPSFVPYVTFDVRTNWFKLTNPKVTEISMRDTMELSRAIKAMQTNAAVCVQCAHLYRDGEVDRLLRRVDQIDRELPLQTMQVQIPFENTSGGFEMFNHGVTDLAPELVGWYGAPGVRRGTKTTLFLVGDGFCVHGGQVIAGGRLVETKLLSRQVMEVVIPPDAAYLVANQPTETVDSPDDESPKKVAACQFAVDVHLATPYGVSSHLLIPVSPEPSAAASAPLAWRSGVVIAMWYKHDGSAMAEHAQVNAAELAIGASAVAGLGGARPVTIRLTDADTKTVNLGAVQTKFNFDPTKNEFFLRGTELDALLKALQTELLPYVKHLAGPEKKPPQSVAIVAWGEMLDGGRPLPVEGLFTIQLAQLPPEK